MTMRHAFLILIGISLIKSLPLRPSDLRGSHGHIIHYHSNGRGSPERHIHFHPPVNRTQPSHTLKNFLRPSSSLSDPGTLYEVPSGKHYNRGGETGHIDVAIKEISDDNAKAQKAMALTRSSFTIKEDDQIHLPSLQRITTKTIRHADLPVIEGLNSQQHLPHDNQDFTVKLSNESVVTSNATNHIAKVQDRAQNISNATKQDALFKSVSISKTGDNLVRVSGLLEIHHTQHTNLSIHRHNQTNLSGSSQNLDQAKQDKIPLYSMHNRSHIQHQKLNESTGSENGTKVSQPNVKDKLVIGMFKTHSTVMRNLQMVRETRPMYSAHTEYPFEEDYQRSTIHTGPITKRGALSDISRMRSETFIDNIFNFRFSETTTQTNPSETQPTIALATTQAVTTPEIISVKSTATPATETPTTISGSLVESPATVHVAHNDLIQLSGVHIVFSNGLQNASNEVPTIHLTASLTPPNTSSPGSKQVKSGNTASHDIIEKLVGTAVIRNGHLYLVIYPFGQNKSIDMIFNKTHHKRVDMSLPQAPLPVPETTHRTTVTTTPMPTTKEKVVDILEAFASTLFLEQSALDEQQQNGTLDEHHQHQHIHDHQAHKHYNATGTERVLNPVPRYMSPWHNISLSKIGPYPGRNSSINLEKEDNDYELFQFIANASDPFEQIQAIIETITNASKLTNSTGGDESNSSDGKAAFNFELKIQTNIISENIDIKPTTPVVDSSEEVTDSNIDSPNIKSPSDPTSTTTQLLIKANTHESKICNMTKPKAYLSKTVYHDLQQHSNTSRSRTLQLINLPFTRHYQPIHKRIHQLQLPTLRI